MNQPRAISLIRQICALGLGSALLVGCHDPAKDVVTDQCLRKRAFAECMARIPVGPSHVVNNDWDEVVSECESASYYQARRYRFSVKWECMAP